MSATSQRDISCDRVGTAYAGAEEWITGESGLPPRLYLPVILR